jgi:pyruvate-ferredoxin/flavodoxin oxidoreductase
VNTGQWLLYRYNPERLPLGENPLQLDSAAPRVKLADFFKLEQRFKILEKSEPRAARDLLAQAQADVNARREFYEFFATRKFNTMPNL